MKQVALPGWLVCTPLIQVSFFILLMLACPPRAAAQTAPNDEPDFIVPARPTVSNPAEFQRPGVLQIELGYNSNLRAPGVRVAQDLPLALRLALSRRWLLELDGDNPVLQTSAGSRLTGAGDTQIGIQGVLQHEEATHPGVAIAYYVKLPTASSEKGFGTGRVDHSLVAFVSKDIGATTVDFNAVCLIAGRTSGAGHVPSGQFALAASRNITPRWGIQGEFSGLGRNDEQSGSLFLLGAVTYQVNRRLVLDSGARTGLTRDAPQVGFFAGMTVGGTLFKGK